jgi:hypothetical protein
MAILFPPALISFHKMGAEPLIPRWGTRYEVEFK